VEARAFASVLSEILNRTVTDGVRLRAVTVTRPRTFVVVGYKIDKRNPVSRQAFPLVGAGRKTRAYMLVSYRLIPDDACQYLTVESSAVALATDADCENELLHYDYERDKGDGYPEAHLQISASSACWEALGSQISGSDGKPRPLSRLHLPVGPRRFRPALEDVIEFLIAEKIVDGKPGWEAVVRASRHEFEVKQLRAAIRNAPDVALTVLKEQQHIT
jgi:hypothetical protein